ncbi:MAG TPA: AI-2E family transporter [Chitinophagaceae bacterium]|nr:AI-2E family transporter [Chitinophagaceae bacterium]
MIRTWPLYAKLAMLMVLLFFLFYVIYLGQNILLPLGFSFLFAVLLRPLEVALLRLRIPRVIAILLVIVIALLVVIGVIIFISSQIASFMSDVPAVKRNLDDLWRQSQKWIDNTFHLTARQQDVLLEQAKSETVNNFGAVGTFNVITTSLATLTLIPVYVFLFMYYRTLLLRFIVQVFEDRHTSKVEEIMMEIRYVVQHYITGLMTETTIVAILNTVGLLLIGAPYAVLLGLVGAIMNLIPYIGGLLAIILTALLTFTNTGSAEIMTWAILVYLLVQLIDNNFLVPYIIGSRVKLNALFSIVGVLLGGALCGIGGMFLSIPIIAICKVIFDRIDHLRPWGQLLGDDVPAWNPLSGKNFRRRKKEAPQK